MRGRHGNRTSPGSLQRRGLVPAPRARWAWDEWAAPSQPARAGTGSGATRPVPELGVAGLTTRAVSGVPVGVCGIQAARRTLVPRPLDLLGGAVGLPLCMIFPRLPFCLTLGAQVRLWLPSPRAGA